jgi:hypothetical protein
VRRFIALSPLDLVSYFPTASCLLPTAGRSERAPEHIHQGTDELVLMSSVAVTVIISPSSWEPRLPGSIVVVPMTALTQRSPGASVLCSRRLNRG